MTLESSLLEFLEGLAGQSAANRTNYERRIRPFLAAYGDLAIREITRADVNAYIAALEERGYAEATMAGYKQAIKSFLSWCAERAGISSPARHIKVGSFISKRSKVPPETAVSRLSALARDWLASEKPDQVRDGLIWLLSEFSGPRLREIRELRKSEVEAALWRGPDAEGIYRATSRGKTGEITIRFDGRLASGFRRWLAVRPDAPIDICFVGTRQTTTRKDKELRYRPLSRSGATKIYQRLAAAAGVERAVLSHALRHRRGDETTRRFGAKVTAIVLNHADQETGATALAYYHHPDEGDASKALSTMASRPEDEETHRAILQLFFSRRRDT
jgi:integrase